MEFDVKAFREAKGYKRQSAFADAVGYRQTMISQIENGQKKMSDKLLLRIEEVFKINLDPFKRYDRNKKGLYFEEMTDSLSTVEATLEKTTGVLKQEPLLFEGLSAEDLPYQETPELLKENNLLLKELLACLKEVLRRMPSPTSF